MFYIRSLLTNTLKPKTLLRPAAALSTVFFTMSMYWCQTNWIEGKDEGNGQILVVDGVDKLSQKQLKGHKLVWFEMTGNETIDKQVVCLLHSFVNERKNRITNKFKVVILEKSSSGMSGRTPAEIAILKKQDLKVIPLNRHLSYANHQQPLKLPYKSLFNKLTLQIDAVQTISAQNIRSIVTEQLHNAEYMVLMNSSSNEKKKSLKEFDKFITEKFLFASGGRKYLIGDHVVENYLGLAGKQKNKVYALLPFSKNITDDKLEWINIQGKRYCLIESDQVNKCTIFPPFIEKSSPNSLSLKVSVDPNQNIEKLMEIIYEQFGKIKRDHSHPLKNIPCYIIKEQKKEKPMEIFLQLNNYDQVVKVYDRSCRFSKAQKEQLLKNSHQWKFTGLLNESQLRLWSEKVLNNQAQQHYSSQSEKVGEDGKVIRQNSTRIVGQEYLDILKSQKERSKVVFHFSENCFSCKKFKGSFEQIVNEVEDVQFYRINNDFNKVFGLRNYHSTPVFIIYKNMIPFIYKSDIFTKKLFKDFVTITDSLSVMKYSQFQKKIHQHEENKNLIQELF